tara:strand:- start:5093 stop:5677 length:585 start_codon:yes stop_codon:yes gene_type:complete
MARRRTRNRTRKSRRRSRRKSRRKSRRTRKSRRRKSRRRKSRRRKRQRGGCGCSSGKGLFSGGSKVQVNKLNLKVMEPPVSTNNNWNVPRNPTQLGGRRRKKYKKRYTKKNKKQRGGASLLRTIGLGDALQGYYSATDFATNTQNKWAGRKKITSSNPIRQPKMMKSASSQYRIPNVPEYHRLSSAKAAKHVLK